MKRNDVKTEQTMNEVIINGELGDEQNKKKIAKDADALHSLHAD